MKKILLATTGLAGLMLVMSVAGPATAADIRPAYKTPYAPPPPPCAQFGGFYLGANVGWGYYDHRFSDRDRLGGFIDDDLAGDIHTTKSGANGGIQGGYNWQSRCTLFGVEADWSWTSLNAAETITDGDAVTRDTMSVSSRLRSFGTLRARTGVVVDNLLLYVTGGFAAARFNRNWTFFEDGPPTTGVFNDSSTRWGWTMGLGTEWALWNNWSIKSEVLYMRFNEDRLTVSGNGIIGAAGGAYRLDSHDSLWVTRIGLNWRFGGAPAYARY